MYFGLDRGGALLWQRLADGATAADLVDTLAITCDGVGRDRLTEDVRDFLAALDRHGLLARVT